MTQYALPVVYAVLVWWISTGAVLAIVGRSRTGDRWCLAGAAVLFAASLYGLGRIGADASLFGTYAAFTLAILLWGAIEISFLTGYITGPMRSDCPPGCEPWLRTTYAIGAILWHELLLLAAGVAAIVVSWGMPNQIGAWTFALLWVMRLSAKLNLFLGVPVLNDQLLPKPVAHLKSYFRKGPVSLFFPVSVTLATVVTVLLVDGRIAAQFIRSEGLMLLAALSALAVLEHWFMVLPIPLERLWRTTSEPESATPSAHVVTIVRDGLGSGAPHAQPEPPPSRDNVLPHPALARQRRRS
jgi:putative photosynthetic complex assembly protein 2